MKSNCQQCPSPDPYKLNIAKVRASIKREALIVLDNGRAKHSDEDNGGGPQCSQFREDTSNAVVRGVNEADIDHDDINHNNNKIEGSVLWTLFSVFLVYYLMFVLFCSFFRIVYVH
jgi:hypothetical protein